LPNQLIPRIASCPREAIHAIKARSVRKEYEKALSTAPSCLTKALTDDRGKEMHEVLLPH